MAGPVKVKKWGNSMAVVIPSAFAKAHNISVGTVIDLEPIRVLKGRRRYKLSELMNRFKPERRHGGWGVGGPVGREIW